MTKTEACRRVALAALVAGTMAVAQEASAGMTNGLDLNGFAADGTLPPGVSPDGANPDGANPDCVQIADKPTPDPNPKRGSSAKGGSRGRG
jgi:hypothetical protein